MWEVFKGHITDALLVHYITNPSPYFRLSAEVMMMLTTHETGLFDFKES